jgi:hypothetical protein
MKTKRRRWKMTARGDATGAAAAAAVVVVVVSW